MLHFKNTSLPIILKHIQQPYYLIIILNFQTNYNTILQTLQQITKYNNQTLITNMTDKLKPEQFFIQNQQIYDSKLLKPIAKLLKKIYIQGDVASLIYKIKKGKIIQQHEGVIGIRKLLQQGKQTTLFVFDKIIENELLPYFIAYITQRQQIQLLAQATHIISIISDCQEQYRMLLIQMQSIPLLLNLLQSEFTSIVFNAINGLNNLSVTSVQARHQILQGFIIPQNINITKSIKNASYNMLVTIVKNTKDSDNLPVNIIVAELCCGIAEMDITSEKTFKVVCEALEYACGVEMMISSGILPIIVQYLHDWKEVAAGACFQIVYKVTLEGSKEQIFDLMIKMKVMGIIKRYLQKQVNEHCLSIDESICDILAKVMQKSSYILIEVLKTQNLLRNCMKLLQLDNQRVYNMVYLIFDSLFDKLFKMKFDKIMDILKKYNIFDYVLNLLWSDVNKLVKLGLNFLDKVLVMSKTLDNTPGMRYAQNKDNNPKNRNWIVFALTKTEIDRMLEYIIEGDSPESKRKAEELYAQFFGTNANLQRSNSLH